MFLPPENHIFRKIGLEIVWGTYGDVSWVAGSAYNQQNHVSTSDLGYYCQKRKDERKIPYTAKIQCFSRVADAQEK